MKLTEILRLVWINLIQNKSKVILTSIGIVAGSATIMLVLAIGRGGQMEVAEQFKNLNVGAIDIVYDENSDTAFSGFPGGGSMGGGFPPGGGNRGGGNRGGFPGFFRRSGSSVSLSEEDLNAITEEVTGLSDATISFSTKADVEGGNLEEASSYTIAGVKTNYAVVSNLELEAGEFLTEENEESKEKVCVLGNKVAREIFGSVYDANDNTIYLDGRPYIVAGIAEEMGALASGISTDEAIFIPYTTGIKYLTGTEVNPTITLIAADVETVPEIIVNVEAVLKERHPRNTFSISDAGSKMEAASKSNETLQLLLIAMACIVFLVGGIGIMNVLFVSVKERTNEIGILKAIGCSRNDILLEFLMEAACISLVGAVLGVLFGLCITPIIESFHVRVELTVWGALLSLAFGILTGTLFGFYPASKASKMIPVEALNVE